MKKKFIAIALLVISFTNAQTEEKEIPKVAKYFYFGIGGTSQSYKLNDLLRNSNVATLSNFDLNFDFGMNFFAEKYSGDVEFTTSLSRNDNANSENQNIGFTSRLRFHYNVINKEKYALTTGLNIAYSGNQATFFSKNRTIDLNNPQPSFTNGEFTLNNEMLYVGPSLSVYLFKNKKNKIRLNAGYEFAITNGKWKSDFANVTNTVKENGNNRFIFGISFL